MRISYLLISYFHRRSISGVCIYIYVQFIVIHNYFYILFQQAVINYPVNGITLQQATDYCNKSISSSAGTACSTIVDNIAPDVQSCIDDVKVRVYIDKYLFYFMFKNEYIGCLLLCYKISKMTRILRDCYRSIIYNSKT